MTKITEQNAIRVLEVVDKGLTYGLGNPKPGKMCVEAAVCFAFGERHDDNPKCVDGYLVGFKIDLNDQEAWKSKLSRARGLRRLAIAQLGTADKFDDVRFQKLVIDLVARTILPNMIRADASRKDYFQIGGEFDDFKEEAEELAAKLERRGAAACVVNAIPIRLASRNLMQELVAQRAKGLSIAWTEPMLVAHCEGVVQILIKMKTQGSKFLYLTETPQTAPKIVAKPKRKKVTA